MKRQEASYTVELSLLMPVLLFVLFMPVSIGYDLYSQAKEASVCGWEASFGADARVRNIKFAGKLWEELK